MNKFKFYFILLITSITIFSCSKNDDSATIEPPRDYAVQYKTDSLTIDTYLRTNYITTTNAPGETSDQDVVISKITDATTQNSIMSYLDAATYPKLLKRLVKQNNVDYTLYYLVLREGKRDAVTGLGGVSPCNVDNVLTSYKGTYLSNTTATETTPSTITATQFDELIYPETYFELFTTLAIPLRGWSEIFPQFKTGSYFSRANGTISYTDFGAGVMFLPSGLGYYNTGAGSIPAYAPLVFSFKLYEIQRADQDNDGIPSYLEEGENSKDGYMKFYSSTATVTDAIRYADDYDKDGTPDFLDVDDDGDNYTTRLEITKPGGSNLLLDGPSLYYPYDPIVSDPPKATDEKRGIPAYSTGTPDYTSPNRKRIHLDKDHHTAKP